MGRLALFLVLACACASRESVREYRGYVFGTQGEGRCSFLVRDRITGRPIVGAVVSQHPEWQVDRNGRWAPLVAQTRTDEFGVATFDVDAGQMFHFAVRAKGYAPAEGYGNAGTDEEIVLWPGERRTGRLVDAWGKPVAGAEVEYKTGCAHAPALRVARTDRDGVFVFDDISYEGDITFEDPRVRADYMNRSTPGHAAYGITTWQALPPGTVRGRVVMADGSVPEWAVVQSYTSSRGPRIAVGRDGRFVLRGADPTATLFVHWAKGVKKVDMRSYRPGGPIVIRLGGDGPADAPPARLRIVLKDGGGKGPAEVCAIFGDRVDDGRRFKAEWDPEEEGPTELELPEGEYYVSVGELWSRHVSAPRRVTVRGTRELAVVVVEQPVLDFTWEDCEPVNTVRLMTRERTWQEYPRAFLEGAEVEADPVYVPATGELWVRFDHKYDSYVFPVGPVSDGKRPVRVRLPGRKQIALVDLEDDFTDIYLWRSPWADVDAPQEIDEPPTLETSEVGRFWLEVRHDERGRALREIELPWGAKRIEIRGLVFEKPETREMRVLDASGRPLASAGVSVFPGALPDFDRLLFDGDGETDADGRLRDPWLMDGAWIEVWLEDGIYRTRLRGEPPYEVRLPGARIEVAVEHLTEPVVVFDGNPTRAGEDPVFVVRHVTPGWHDLLVGAPGHYGLAYRLQIKEGETRRIRPVLRPRTPSTSR